MGTLSVLGSDGLIRFPFPGLMVSGFGFSPSGRLYAAGARGYNPNRHTVFSVSSAGVVTPLLGILPTTSPSDEGLPMAQARLKDVGDVAFDANGMLYVVDTGNHRIVAVGSDGLVRRAVSYANPAYPAAIVFGGGFPGFHILQSVFILRTTGLPTFSSPFEVTSGAPEDQGWFSSGLDVDLDGCARGCNPVDLTSGAKLDYALDYKNNSPFPIVWERRYDSRSGVWVFGYERSVVKTPAAGINPETATLKRPDSSVVSFHRNGSGNWVPNKEVYLGKLSDGPGQTLLYSNLAGEVEVYSATGQLVELRNHQGQKLVFTYHTNGDLQKVEDDFGRHLDVRLTATTAGTNPISISDGTRQIGYTFTTTSVRRILDAVQWPDTTQTQYLYDEAMVPGRGLLTGIIGRDNVRYATYTYSVDEKVESSSHGAGEDLTVYTIYPGSSASVSWENGSAYFDLSSPTPGVEHKTKGSETPCPNCSGASVKAVDYNARGSATSMTTFQGVEIQRSVAPDGLVLSETRAPGTSEETTIVYTWNHDTRQLLSMVEPTVVNGTDHTRTTVLAYDGANRLTSKTVTTSSGEPARAWTWTYNAKGQVLTKTDPVTGTDTYTYDSTSGNMLSVTNALGHQTTFSNHTPSGQPRKVVDPNGLETLFTLDANEQVVEIKRGSPSTHWETQEIDYTPNGQVAKMEEANGSFVEFSYDAAYRLVEIRDNRGKLVFTLNNDGDVIKEEMFASTGTLLKTEGFEYDYRRRLKASVDAQNKKTTRYYNDYSNLYLGLSDPEGETNWQSYTQYDTLGRPSAVSNDYYTRGFSFDKTDQLTSVHDGNWVFTHYGYNGFGELQKIDSPDGGLRTFGRSPAGLVVSNTDARGAEVTLTHDALGRVLTASHDGSQATGSPVSETQSFVYDTCQNGIGRLCSMTDHSGTTEWTYDLWGRVLSKTVSPAGLTGVSLVTSYAYNSQGDLLSMTYPSGRRLDYAMDRGRIAQLNYDFQPILWGASYRPMQGSVTGWTWASFSGTVALDYDLNGRVSSITDADERNYLRDARGWIRAITDPLDANADQLYSYKTDGSLIQADLAARPAPIDFTLDENFNILTKRLGPLTVDVVNSDFYTNYSINNRPTAVWGSGFYYALTFDEMGNMLNNGNGLTLTYDAKGRMRTSARLGMTTDFAINALGQRVRKSGSHLSTGHRIYAYDEAGRLLGQYDGTGTALEEYVYLDGHHPVALVRNLTGVSSVPVIHPILTDHLGTPRKVLSPSGSPLWTWDAKDPYGHQAPDVLVGGSAFEFDLRFPGQIYDVETGLYHNGHRDYDPASGRYVQADPIGLAGGWNPYSYVGANPLNFTDSKGLACDQRGCWVTPVEQAYADTGNYGLYYQAACAGGDPYACRAREVALNQGLLSGITNTRLANSIVENSKEKTCEAVELDMRRKMENIRVGLAREHVKAIRNLGGTPLNPVMLDRKTIADFHLFVFLENGAGGVFGGSTWDKYMGWSGGVIYDWCPSPSCHQ